MTKKQKLHFKEGEIWFADFSGAVGCEQRGKGQNNLRPVVVLNKYNGELFWGIPCTTSQKNNKYYLEIGSINNRKNSVILSQNRVFDVSRLKYRLGRISDENRKNIIKSLQKILEDIL